MSRRAHDLVQHIRSYDRQKREWIVHQDDAAKLVDWFGEQAVIDASQEMSLQRFLERAVREKNEADVNFALAELDRIRKAAKDLEAPPFPVTGAVVDGKVRWAKAG